jgi:hypothetical protein
MLEFRVSKAQIVTVKLSIGSHFARQQTPANGAAGQHEQFVLQSVPFNGSFDWGSIASPFADPR